MEKIIELLKEINKSNTLLVIEFRNYLNTLDDELFIKICENLGNENLHKINYALESKIDLENNIQLFIKELIKITLEDNLNRINNSIKLVELNELTNEQFFLNYLDMLNKFSVIY